MIQEILVYVFVIIAVLFLVKKYLFKSKRKNLTAIMTAIARFCSYQAVGID